MADKVSTGVEKLDEILGGGLLPGSIILVIGEPGTGKTTLVRNFVREGVEKGEDCIFLMTNRSLDHVLKILASSGWNVEDKPNLKFITYNGVATKRIKSFVGNFEDLIDVAYNCERLISSFEHGSARMAIDDLSYMFLMNSKDLIFKFLNRITQILREHEATCMMEMQKGMLDPQIVTALESLTDGTIEMKREGNKRSFRVSRMEDTEVKPNWVDFLFSSGTGLEIEAEKTLNEWEKMLTEKEKGDEDTDVAKKIDGMQKKKLSASQKKGLFNFIK